MICIDAEQLQDGLYNIKNGKIYKYRAKGGTSRVYRLESRPQGEWVDYNGKPTAANYSGTCSVCGTWSEYLLNYCPYCGAKMKGASR